VLDTVIETDICDYEIRGYQGQYKIKKMHLTEKGKRACVKTVYCPNLVFIMEWIARDYGSEFSIVDELKELIEIEKNILEVMKNFAETFYKMRKFGTLRLYRPKEDEEDGVSEE